VKVAVLGLWHQGAVTAACLASAGHDVAAWDPDAAIVASLGRGEPAVAEPGLRELVAAGQRAGRLRVTSVLGDAVGDAAIVWIAFDTPVDADDRADVDFVLRQAAAAFPHLASGALVISSSQLPVGSVARLEREFAADAGGRQVTFACLPENLRLGRAIEVFTKPDRVVVGVRSDADRAHVEALLAPVTTRLEFMGVESAEMTKHAVNAFLATSIAFINELASICEQYGADARDVERGLKTEARIGPRAYLKPGAAFAGGTLARDVVFLRELGTRAGRATPFFDGVEASNRAHRGWASRRLLEEIGTIAGAAVGVWGLAYKPGTSTLRRSTSVELCKWLVDRGFRVRAHDPQAEALPDTLRAVVRAATPIDAARGAAALVVATEWPDYREVDADALAQAMPAGVVLDPNGYVARTLGADRRFRVVSVGMRRRSNLPGAVR
jgi:UDPglucose 6-dehydrogenase